jgi:hypothetical protein
MRRLIVLATAYPYTAGILAIIWIGSACLLRLDSSLDFNTVIISDVISTILISWVGFRK